MSYDPHAIYDLPIRSNVPGPLLFVLAVGVGCAVVFLLFALPDIIARLSPTMRHRRRPRK